MLLHVAAALPSEEAESPSLAVALALVLPLALELKRLLGTIQSVELSLAA